MIGGTVGLGTLWTVGDPDSCSIHVFERWRILWPWHVFKTAVLVCIAAAVCRIVLPRKQGMPPCGYPMALQCCILGAGLHLFCVSLECAAMIEGPSWTATHAYGPRLVGSRCEKSRDRSNVCALCLRGVEWSVSGRFVPARHMVRTAVGTTMLQ